MLNPNAIYRKTDAGIAEVQARAKGLRAELRRLLILTDGIAPVVRLSAFVRGSEIEFLLAELELHGLITSVGNDSTSSEIGIAAPVAPGVGTAEGLLEPTVAQMQAVRRMAIRTLHDMLGPDADDLAVKIERCKDANEMRVAITDVRLILDRRMGIVVGQRFLDAVRGAAEGTR